QADLLAIDDQGMAVHADVAFEAAMHAVVLQHVGKVLGLEQIVDADHLDVLEILDGGAEHHASDAPEAVDADLDGHVLLLKGLKLAVVIAGLPRHPCWRKIDAASRAVVDPRIKPGMTGPCAQYRPHSRV